MKRFFAYILVLLLALSFTGCSTGESGNGPVKVNLAISSDSLNRIVTVDDSVDFNTFSIYYKATPQWTGSDFTSVPGAVASFQKINSYYSGVSLGFFAQGSWLFEIEARLTSDETTVVFSGSVETYISSSNRNVMIPVYGTSTAQGTVSITVYAPTVSENDVLRIDYTGADSGTVDSNDITINRAGGENRWTTFTLQNANFDAGLYTFFLNYNSGTADVGGAVVAVNVKPGMPAAITGTIEAGAWQEHAMTLTGLNNFSVSVTAGNNVEEINENGGTVLFTCNKTGELNIASYQWYVNGAPQAGATGTTFRITASTPASGTTPFHEGFYTVTCIAKAVGDSEFIAFGSRILTVYK